MQKKSSLLQHGLFWLLLLVLLVLRRPDQLFHAYVWDEDKNIMLQWFDLGVIKTFLAPINGYLITISKLINFSALHISFLYYPEVSTALSILFDFLVLLMVAYSPNVLGWRKIAALSVVLIPASTEIQILPLYTFWFAGILLLVSLLWQFKQESKTWYAVRIIMMLLGGASSPLIVSLAPAFWLRLIYLRTIRETVIASIATVFALIQGWFVYTQSSYSQPSKMPWYELLKLSYDQFFGKFFLYFARHAHPFYWLGVFAITLGLIWLLVQIKRRVYADKPQFYALLLQLALLGYIALTAIAASCMRIDISIIGQFEPAPRYFFYPYIALSFFLCWLGYHSNQLGKIVILALLTMAFANNIGKYSRPHDVMDWRSQVKACLEGQDGYHFKIFFDGHKDRTWDMYMTTAQCKQLMGKD